MHEDQHERYCRQILAIGEDQQETLIHKKILQVGVGGLGSPLSLYLTAMGIGEIVLFEFDTVSLSNLGRQIMYKTPDIDESKGQITKERLEALNPDVKVTLVEEYLTEANAADYFNDVDYIVDASDNFETKFLINDLGLKFNKPFTIAGIQGFEGQLISVIPHQTSCYRCVFGDIPNIEKKPIPVVSPICGVMGSLEASEIVKSLLGIGSPMYNGLLVVGLLDNEMVKVPVKVNPTCPCQKSE